MMNDENIIWIKRIHLKPYRSPALCKSLPLLYHRVKMDTTVECRDQGKIVSVAVLTTSETRVGMAK